MGSLALKFQEREAKAMKLTLVNFIIATVIIITTVKAGPLKAGPLDLRIEIEPIEPEKNQADAYRSGAARSCKPRGASCQHSTECCSRYCGVRFTHTFHNAYRKCD